jgi:hypothetical protein
MWHSGMLARKKHSLPKMPSCFLEDAPVASRKNPLAPVSLIQDRLEAKGPREC